MGKNLKKFFLALAFIALMPLVAVLLQGCTADVPTATSYFYKVYTPTATPAVPVVCDVLFNGCESLAENGTWSGVNSTRALSSDWFTQGTSSLKTTIVNAAGWNDNIMILSAFTPSGWANLKTITADLYMDPNVANGASYSQFVLIVDSGYPYNSKYYRTITSGPATIAAGQQSVTWTLDWVADTLAPPLVPSDPILKMTFVYNRSTPSAGQGTGNIYIDNIKFHYCP